MVSPSKQANLHMYVLNAVTLVWGYSLACFSQTEKQKGVISSSPIELVPVHLLRFTYFKSKSGISPTPKNEKVPKILLRELPREKMQMSINSFEERCISICASSLSSTSSASYQSFCPTIDRQFIWYFEDTWLVGHHMECIQNQPPPWGTPTNWGVHYTAEAGADPLWRALKAIAEIERYKNVLIQIKIR